jgi:hypothetical protein
MTFETKVLASVNKLLTPGDRAEFTHGTLFVQSTEAIASKVLDVLTEQLKGTSSVKLTKWATATEYAFDFTPPKNG